ncbi:MAG: hypothetical protein JO041_04450 [Acidobacteria bacterium]|nr:hypothetical protein [Acidobacteriota bacterium]
MIKFWTNAGWLWLAGGFFILLRLRRKAAPRALAIGIIGFGLADACDLLPDSAGAYGWWVYAIAEVVATLGFALFLWVEGRRGSPGRFRNLLLAAAIALLWLIPALWADNMVRPAIIATSSQRVAELAAGSLFALWYAMGALLAERFYVLQSPEDHDRRIGLALLCAGAMAFPVYDQAWWLAAGQWFNLGVGAGTLLSGFAWLPKPITRDRTIAQIMTFVPAGLFVLGMAVRSHWRLDPQKGLELTFTIVKDVGLLLMIVGVQHLYLRDDAKTVKR